MTHPWRCACGQPDCPSRVAAEATIRARREQRESHARLMHEFDGSRPSRVLTDQEKADLRLAGWTPANRVFIDLEEAA